MKAIESKSIAKKKMRKLIGIGIGAAVVLLGLLAVCLKLTWRPSVIEKDSFTEEDKKVIAGVLGIPDESLNIKHMKFSHAKDTYFCVTAKTDSMAVIGKYEPMEQNGDTVYVRKDENDPHGDITCKVVSEDPLVMDFELHTWNRELYDIIKE